MEAKSDVSFSCLHSDGMADLIIGYEPLEEEETYVTVAKYDLALLLANIGGQLGLFTGFSALTGFEVFELLTDMCRTLVHRLVVNIRL